MLGKKRTIFRRISAWLSFNPPGAMTTKGWRLFEQEFKEKAPIRYWYKETFKHKMQAYVSYRYKKIREWIYYRIEVRYHVVKTGLQPDYHCVDERMLHANFNLLKDYVEVDLAWQSQEKISFGRKHIPLYNVFVPFRDKAAGLKNLEWSSTLDDPSLPIHERCERQAAESREILALYKWWTETRPARTSPELTTYDDQGLGILASLDTDFDDTREDYKKFIDGYSTLKDLEEQWDKEDDENLIRLIKIRKSLWT